VYEFQAAFTQPGARRIPDEDAPTLLDDLVERAIVAHQANKHLDSDGVPKKQRAQWRKHGPFFGNPDVRNLTRERVHDFADHLYANRLERSTANEHLRLVRMACDMAMELKLTPTNVARGVVGCHQDNPRTQRDRVQPRPLTPTEVKTLAAQFPAWLRLGVLLMYVACLRISEVFGLELRDWDPVTQTLSVRRQGGLGKNEGKRDPYRAGEADGRLKTKSSRRRIPVASALAEVIDQHIEAQHGPRPLTADLELAWLKRRMISTAELPKPRQGVITDRWEEALHDVGLDFDSVGFKIGRHFLRKAGSTVIGIGDIRGKLWSSYLGHETPAEFGGSLTTVRHYFDLPDEELVAVAERWEQVIREDVGDLIISEEMANTPHMTRQEAALVLGVHQTQVAWLIKQGHLLLAPNHEVTDLRRKRDKEVQKADHGLRSERPR
jgi:integrase